MVKSRTVHLFYKLSNELSLDIADNGWRLGVRAGEHKNSDGR